MAKNKSTSQVRQSDSKGRKPAPTPPATVSVPDALRDAIEQERGRLMNAEAVLHCVIIALDDNGNWNTDGPYYQGVIGIARDLVSKAINQLDSINLDAILAKTQDEADVDYMEIDSAAEHGMKESAPPGYVH